MVVSTPPLQSHSSFVTTHSGKESHFASGGIIESATKARLVFPQLRRAFAHDLFDARIHAFEFRLTLGDRVYFFDRLVDREFPSRPGAYLGKL
jgi:hypothetical protein